MVKATGPSMTAADDIRGGARLRAAVGVAQEEVAALGDVDARRHGLDPERMAEFGPRLQQLLDAGDDERTAQVTHAALALVLRFHARELVHRASATVANRAALERVGATMQTLVQDYGERALSHRGPEAAVAGLAPERRRRGLRAAGSR